MEGNGNASGSQRTLSFESLSEIELPRRIEKRLALLLSISGGPAGIPGNLGEGGMEIRPKTPSLGSWREMCFNFAKTGTDRAVDKQFCESHRKLKFYIAFLKRNIYSIVDVEFMIFPLLMHRSTVTPR